MSVPPTPAPTTIPTDPAARRALMVRLYAEHWSADHIGALLGIDRKTVGRHLHACGVATRQGAAAKTPSPARAARDAKIVEWYGSGSSSYELAEAFRITRQRVDEILLAAGVELRGHRRRRPGEANGFPRLEDPPTDGPSRSDLDFIRAFPGRWVALADVTRRRVTSARVAAERDLVGVAAEVVVRRVPRGGRPTYRVYARMVTNPTAPTEEQPTCSRPCTAG